MIDFATWSTTANETIQSFAKAAASDVAFEIGPRQCTWTCGARWCAAGLSMQSSWIRVQTYEGREWLAQLLGDESAAEAGGRIAAALFDRVDGFGRFAALREAVRRSIRDRMPDAEYTERQPDAVLWRYRDQIATLAYTGQHDLRGLGAVEHIAVNGRSMPMNVGADQVADQIVDDLMRPAESEATHAAPDTEFSRWATALGRTIASVLGAGTVNASIEDDCATWEFGTNAVTASIRTPGEPFVDIDFLRGGGGLEVLYLGGNADIDGTRIAHVLANA